jgi:hypothetical protein
VLQLMQRPQAYDVGNTNSHDMNSIALEHAAMPVSSADRPAPAGAAGSVRSR